jgi:hypothetical protein
MPWAAACRQDSTERSILTTRNTPRRGRGAGSLRPSSIRTGFAPSMTVKRLWVQASLESSSGTDLTSNCRRSRDQGDD